MDPQRCDRMLQLVVMLVLLTVCLGLLYWFHAYMRTGIVFTHFFYIPIILASAWWGKKGVLVAVFLSTITILSHMYIRDGTAPHDDYYRVLMFLVVSGIMAVIGERIFNARMTLQRSEERFLDIALSSTNWIWEVDAAGRYTFASGKVKEIMGYSPAEMIGKTPFDFMAEGEAETIRGSFTDALAQKTRIVDLENWNLHRDGRRRCMLTNGLPILDDRDNVLGYRGTDTDITDRKQAEAERVKLSSIVDAMVDGVVVIDMSGNIAYINRAITEQLDHEPGTVIGQSMEVLIASKDLPEFRSHMQALLGGTRIQGRQEYLALHRNGSEIPYSVSYSILRRDGRPTEIVAVSRNITEDKRAGNEKARLEDQLHQSQKMEAIGRLAGGVAHDFNNLLTVILAYTGVVLSSLKPEDPTHTAMAEVKKAGERAADLVQQLLAFGRKQIVTPKPIHLWEIVARSERMLGRVLGEDIDLRCTHTDRPWRIMADPGQIDQILLNLVVNGRDAMPKGGRLSIETTTAVFDEGSRRAKSETLPGEYMVLTVSDTGCGMDEETRRNIFDPFFTTKELGKGTGLGLATVYGIVRQSNGYIYAQSEPGEGTTFEILFPRAWSEAQAAPEPRAGPLPGGRETLLLVEDEDMVRGVVRAILTKRGYTVLEARDGTEALAFVDEHEGGIDLMLTDVVMPGMNGNELACQLKAVMPELKVLYMSGHTYDAIAQRGVLEDDTALLRKPFTAEVLTRKVRDVLDG